MDGLPLSERISRRNSARKPSRLVTDSGSNSRNNPAITSGQPLRNQERVPSKSKMTWEISARGKTGARTARCSLADAVTGELRHFGGQNQRGKISGKLRLANGPN